MPGLVPEVCAVNFCGFVKVARDALESGQVDHDSVSDPPEPGKDNPPLGVGRFLQPVRRRKMRAEHGVDDAERGFERVVDQAQIPVEHPLPEHGEADHRHERRQKENRPEDPFSRQVEIQQNREGKRHDESQRDREGRKEKRVVNRLPENRVREHVPVVLRADKHGRREHRVVAHRIEQAAQKRVNAEREKAEDPRADEQQPEPEVVFVAVGHGLSHSFVSFPEIRSHRFCWWSKACWTCRCTSSRDSPAVALSIQTRPNAWVMSLL